MLSSQVQENLQDNQDIKLRRSLTVPHNRENLFTFSRRGRRVQSDTGSLSPQTKQDEKIDAQNQERDEEGSYPQILSHCGRKSDLD